MTTTVEILSRVKPALKWHPTEGVRTSDFLSKKRQEFGLSDVTALDDVLIEAQTILGRYVPPTEPSGQGTGLVIGYVQSGKTLSFTTIMALAQDNGYQLIILLAGVAINLKRQSEKRLANDLGLETDDSPWVHFENPEIGNDDHTAIQQALDVWKLSSMPLHKRQTILMTVLKNHKRLVNLSNVLSKLKLHGVPALIIDDEGDQASLNTKAFQNLQKGNSDTSKTYDAVVDLKSALPHHTLLQYTATPQGNLLLGIADVLSPSFAEFVSPGRGYIGGEYFFASTARIVQAIPVDEVPGSAITLSSAPASLMSALRFFLLGAAAHMVTLGKGKRSMMIHPSQKTDPHADYKRWAADCISSWKNYLSTASTSPVYSACAAQFEPEYRSLQTTCSDLPPFDALVAQILNVITLTSVVEVNYTSAKVVDWKKHHYWILVGGQKLDRGFTVEGLTVTYMPRGLGTANADTLQQRARFFGYKAPYAGYCRVFLQRDVLGAFEEYVKHEASIREELTPFQGEPLWKWKRDFILKGTLNPTRQNVIGMVIRAINVSGWTVPGAVYKDPQAVQENRQLFQQVLTEWKSSYQTGDAAHYPQFKDNRAGSPRNILIEAIPLQKVLDELLLRIRVPDFADSEELTALNLILATFLKRESTAVVDVFLLGNLEPQTRSLTNGRINQVFSGKSPNTEDFDKLIYVGDRALHALDRIALHLRHFNLKSPPPLSHATFDDVPWYAVYVPGGVSDGAVVESQGHWNARS
jgi:Z1 domain